MIVGKINYFSWEKFALLLFAFHLFIISTVLAQNPLIIHDQADFEKELRQAVDLKNESRVTSLIRFNRLKVKPFLLSLTDNYLESDLNNDRVDAEQALSNALTVAETFDNLFQEKSLINIVNNFLRWTSGEKLEKFRADSLNKLATSYRGDRERDDESLQLYDKALSIYRDINDTYGKAVVYGGVGYIYWFYNTDSTLHYYDLALRAREQLDDRQLMAASLNGIGLVYDRFLSDYEKALEYYKRAEKIRREIGDWRSLGTTLTYKASVYQNSGMYKEAAETFRISYDVNKKAGDSTRMAEAKVHSGTLLNYLGSFDEALDDLSEAMKICREINDSTGLGDALTQITSVYVNLGDYTSAIGACSESVKIMQALGDDWGLAGAYNNMGIVLQSAGRLERSAEYYRLALEKYEELENIESVSIILNNLGTVFYEQEDYVKAEEYHSKGLEQAGEIGFVLLEMHCQVNLANDQNKLGKLDDALSNYTASLSVADTLDNPEGKWKALVGIAENYKIREEYEKAIEYNEQALDIIEDIRSSMQRDEFKANYLARERYAFEDVISLLGKLDELRPGEGYDRKAFALAEKCKARALLDLLSDQDLESSDENILDNRQPVSLEDFQNACLDNSTCLIEYSTGDSCSWVWLVSSDDELLIKLPPHDTIIEQVELLRFALEQPGDDNIDYLTESGCSLYEILIGPFANHLGNFDNLIIVPDGILNYLPFEALITVDNFNPGKDSYSGLPYLVQKFSVTYAQSASVLYNLEGNDRDNTQADTYTTDLVAFGDPYYGINEESAFQGTNELSRLKNTAKEVEGIAGLFPESRQRIFEREYATEDNFKAKGLLSGCRYLHLATHGILNDNNPDLNSIALAQDDDPEEDGFLQTSEIFKLSTGAELVVLSACQTGLGKMVRGEGMLGLTRAFMYAGAPSVMVSLWSVSDASTTDLMQSFYRNMIVEGHSKQYALREAKLSMIENVKYAHPFYWAPFILVGDRR